VLLAPDSAFAIDNNLRGEDALNPARHTLFGFFASGGRDEGELIATRGSGLQQFHDLDHRVVVERDAVVIAACERPYLRPPAVGILRGEEVVNAFEEAGAVGVAVVAWGLGLDFGEKVQFGVGGVVVDRPDVAPVRVADSAEVIGSGQAGGAVRAGGVALAGQPRRLAHVEVLAPSAGRSLEREDDVGDVRGLGGGIPGSVSLQRNTPRVATMSCRRRHC
jgi:hypothetical protein